VVPNIAPAWKSIGTFAGLV